MLPRMNFFSRVFSPDVFSAAAKAFDHSVVHTFCTLLKLPSLTPEAKIQLSLPIRDGGFGLRSMQLVSPAAWWCALAQSALHFAPFLALDAPRASLPFVKAQSTCHSFFSSHHLTIPTIPARAADFWPKFKRDPAPSGTQRLIVTSINNSRLTTLINSFPPSSPQRARLVSPGSLLLHLLHHSLSLTLPSQLPAAFV